MLFVALTSIFLFTLNAAAQAAWSSQSSPEFVIRSRPAGDCSFNNTLGYLHPTYISSTPYAGVLRQLRSDAVAGYFTFLPDAHSSSLVFPRDGINGSFYYGFYVNKDVTNQLVSLPVSTYGGQGVYADAAHRIQIIPEPQVSFYGKPQQRILPVAATSADAHRQKACSNWPLDGSIETAVFTKISNSSIPTGCVDIDLVVDYLDDQYNYPVPCPQVHLSLDQQLEVVLVFGHSERHLPKVQTATIIGTRQGRRCPVKQGHSIDMENTATVYEGAVEAVGFLQQELYFRGLLPIYSHRVWQVRFPSMYNSIKYVYDVCE
ncbi:hypothetical protein K431DRAFT_289966 [Polychaeton citri CBS 116435]|uniref:Uncharacterized protein n=1 Tax=Polychaeton citri CBS 116435 TaxID=1314669 RepID=A0A9P4QJV9_9PEZI|nr:hypothetical protein K431DRAFT_289966 [Polychaeton citri CBS 116435]